MSNSQSGSAAVGVLLGVAFAAVLAGSAATVAMGTRATVVRAHAERTVEAELLAGLQSVVELLAADPTPESDAPSDPVWSVVARAEWGAEHGATPGPAGRTGNVPKTDTVRRPTVTLRDAASLINPNWVRPTFLDRSGLAERLLVPGRTPAGLAQYRVEAGLSPNARAHYAQWFKPAALEALVGGHGLFPLNVSHEAVLRDVVELRTGSPAAGRRFHATVQELLRSGELADADRLRAMAGPAYAAIAPVVHAGSAWNVHFLPEEILRAVITYPYGGEPMSGARDAAERIVAERDTREYDRESLRATIPASTEAHQRVFAYLGTQTRAWEITVDSNGARLAAIVLRLPAGLSRPRPRHVLQTVQWEVTHDW